MPKKDEITIVNETMVRFQEENGVELTPKMQEFVKLYFGRSKKYRHNATQSAFKAYDCKDILSASSQGSHLLRKLKALRQEIMRNSNQRLDYEKWVTEKWKAAKIEGYDKIKDFGAFMGWDEKEDTKGGQGNTNIQINIGEEIEKARRERGL